MAYGERNIKHLDLFSGIGGFALAAEWAWPEIEHVFCEIDPFCQAVLTKQFPNSPIHGDIKQFDGYAYGAVELLTGGFPCQPFSAAGLKRGSADDRDLWPEMFRIIREAKPTWIIGENVVGFVEMELERTITDLEAEGYEVQTFIIPACAIGANHRRDRVWIVGYSERARCEGRDGEQGVRKFPTTTQPEHGADVFIGRDRWQEYCRDLRERNGIPATMARPAVKAYGNAIVPQVAFEIMQAIKAAELLVTSLN